MKHFLLACTIFLSISASAASNPDISNIPDFTMHPEDEAILNSRHNPNKIVDIEQVCDDTEAPDYYHFVLFCNTWDASKGLSDNQAYLFFYIKYLLTCIVMDIYHPCIAAKHLVAFDLAFNAHFVARIFNILNPGNVAECAYESVSHPINSIVSNPCNTDSKLVKMCENKKDVIACMRQNLIDEFPKLVSVIEKKYAVQHMTELTQRTELFIQSTIPDKAEQERQIKRLYNSYWIFIHEIHNGVLSHMDDEDSRCFD